MLGKLQTYKLQLQRFMKKVTVSGLKSKEDDRAEYRVLEDMKMNKTQKTL